MKIKPVKVNRLRIQFVAAVLGAATVIFGCTSPQPTSTVNSPDKQTAPTSTSAIGETRPSGTDPAGGKEFPGTVILANPTDSSITIGLMSDLSAETYVEYGKASGSYGAATSTVNSEPGTPVEQRISGLQADTQYFYRIRYRESAGAGYIAGGEGTFHTRRAAGDSFVFTVDADPHFDTNSDNAKIDLAFRSILSLRPDFDIDLGDTFMAEKLGNPSAQQVNAVYAAKRNDFGIFGASVPLFMVTGNHDGGIGAVSKGQTNSVANFSSIGRETYYQSQYSDGFYGGVSEEVHLAGPHANYYSWSWGDALFVVLDPYWNSQRDKSGWGMTLGKTQYDWLKSTLEESHARFKFVFAHNLVGGSDTNMRGGAEAAKFYEWGGQNSDGSWGFDTNRPGWGKPIHQMLVDNDVTAFFHGHDHFFAKQELDGVVYQECPQPGATNPKSHDAEYGYKDGVFLGSAGFIKVTVSSTSVTLDYIKTYLPSEETAGHKNGEVAYSYTVK